MKKRIAKALRRTANRMDPLSKPTLWPTTNYTTTSNPGAFHITDERMNTIDALKRGEVPEVIEAATVLAIPFGGLANTLLQTPEERSERLLRFDLHTPTRTVSYFRWRDEDGDRFYLRGEFMRRAAAAS